MWNCLSCNRHINLLALLGNKGLSPNLVSNVTRIYGNVLTSRIIRSRIWRQSRNVNFEQVFTHKEIQNHARILVFSDKNFPVWGENIRFWHYAVIKNNHFHTFFHLASSSLDTLNENEKYVSTKCHNLWKLSFWNTAVQILPSPIRQIILPIGRNFPWRQELGMFVLGQELGHLLEGRGRPLSKFFSIYCLPCNFQKSMKGARNFHDQKVSSLISQFLTMIVQRCLFFNYCSFS